MATTEQRRLAMVKQRRAFGRTAGHPRVARTTAAVVTLAFAGVAPTAGAVEGTELVSRASGGTGAPGNSADSTSTLPSVSADGRYVAFQSVASNLVPADTDTVSDIYVRDTAADTTTLVSRASGGAKGNKESDHPSISADGRYVAFRSFADNLHPDDPPGNAESDVFVRDLQTGTTLLVSRVSGLDGAKTNGFAPSISADGRFVAFQSFGRIENDDVTVEYDIHVRDLQLGTTTMASKTTGGAPGSTHSYNPSISPSGRYVAFESQATNLDPADTSPDFDVFVRDRQLGTTVLASRAGGPDGAKGNGNSGEASMSDVPSVAFESIAGNLHPDDVNGTGRFDIFVRDLVSNTTTLTSRGAGGATFDAGSRFPSISADGRRVAFGSDAPLAPPDTDFFGDIFVRDLQTSTTSLADVGNDGVKGGGHLAAISGDGSHVAFESAASLAPDTLGWNEYVRNVFGAGPAIPPPGGGGPGGGAPGGGGSGGVPGGTAAATAPAKANLAGAKATIRVSRNGTFGFRFRAGAGLKGQALFRSAKRMRIGARRKRVTLVRKSFTVPASGVVKLRLKLSRTNRAILRKNRRIRTTVTITLTNAQGLSSTATRTIRLRR
jgi:Tol biopolymer transport system component